jgi:hypothetical protein
MSTHEAHQRLRQLRVAFDELTLTTTGLSLVPQPGIPGDEPAAVFTMRLVGTGSPEVRLRLDAHAATVTARSGSAGVAEIHDDLGVELETAFAWDASVCASAEELAGLLLKHMRRRLKAVAEVTPEG